MEKLDYFLLLKKKYSNMLIYLREIHDTYQTILDIHEINNNIDENNIIYNKMENTCSEICEIEYFLHNLEKDIYKICIHDFVEDVIDIHPEKSINIKYCSICEFTCQP